MNEWAIEIKNLTFSYGSKQTLNGVNLSVPAGSIFGFLGRNGAGKTTTIKILLGLLNPSGGECRVLGIDPTRDPLAVRSRIGYMAEDQQMYGWMKVDEIVSWVASFYPAWDSAFTSNLLERFELPRKSKVKTLSKGQNSKLALLLALGHRPKLVILDDPTLGLDSIARKEFLRSVIGLLQSNGVTVFFSSHLLYEIEPVADHVAILDHGRIIRTAKTDDLRESVRRFSLLAAAGKAWQKAQGILDVTAEGETVSVVAEEHENGLRRTGPKIVAESGLNLDEIFEAYVIGNRGKI